MPTLAVDIQDPYDPGTGPEMSIAGYREMWARLFRPGVVRSDPGGPVDNELEVYADSTGLQVKIRTGAVHIRGYRADVTTEKTLTLDAANTTARVDRIVMRLTVSSNTVQLATLEGTAGSSTPAALTQTESVWEVPLARVAVGASATTVTAGQVTDERIYARARGGVEPGDIKAVAGGVVPTGWLECNGGTVSRVTYAELFAAIGVQHGAGDGSTTFALPNLQGRAIFGMQAGFVNGATGGTNFIGTDHLPSHIHAINHDHADTVAGAAGTFATTVPGGAFTFATTSGTATISYVANPTVDIPAYVGSSGATGGGAEFVPPLMRLVYVIAARP